MKNSHHDEYLTLKEKENLFKQQIRKIMTKEVKALERKMNLNNYQGEISKTVDYLMYFGIASVIGFGVVAYRKLE